VDELQKVFADVDRAMVVEQMRDLAEQPRGPSFAERHLLRMEVHVVAVCVSADDRVLVAKRAKRKILADHWEFGCGRLGKGETFEDCLKREYTADFDVEIDWLVARPVGTYTLEPPAKPEPVPGILFAAFARGTCAPRTSKHVDAQWMTLEQIADLELAVDGLAAHATLAVEAVRELRTRREPLRC